MQIRRIILDNIRSYIHEEIDFPRGTILLSGDVGSGKSSILYALDFALFGIQKSEGLHGNTLLRNGTDSGSVEVHLVIESADVIIKRNLKAGAKGAIQDSGYLIVNGIKKDSTTLELKQKILDLLAYPKELLTKSKSLLYRYTVYTPQEEMKSILFIDKESRLDTLRKVFGIDKYRVVQNNGKLFISNLKSRKKEYSGMIYDLENKRKELQNILIEKEKVGNEINILEPKIVKARENIVEAKEMLNKYELGLKKFLDMKKELEILGVTSKEANFRILDTEYSIEVLKKEINSLDEEIGNVIDNVSEVDTKRKILQERLKIEGEKDKEFLLKIHELRSKKEYSEEMKRNVQYLNKCPVCKQIVTQDYKMEYCVAQEVIIQDAKQGMIRLEREHNENKTFVLKLQKELDSFINLLQKIEINNVKKEQLKEKKCRLIELNKYLLEYKNKITEIEYKKKLLLFNLEGFDEIKNKFEGSKLELDRCFSKEKDLDLLKAGLTSKMEGLVSRIKGVETEVNKKEYFLKCIQNLEKLQNFFEDYFFELLSIMEKQIMTRVYHDFNNLFVDWFDKLIDNDQLRVKLDAEFTPIIIQNGYDIFYNYLSGGEKTACALAYRLALNQVINNLMSKVKTKDLLILDEPTDGFSSDQLDRMKDVLNELEVGQLIIVSHEDKIESFVDNVIKFEKNDHISKIVL